MGFRLRQAALPAALKGSLAPEERVLTAARLDDGSDSVAAATRFGLWTVAGGEARRVDWHHISRARWTGGVLALTIADEVGTWPDGSVLLRDRPEVRIRPQRAGRLTDVVHDRVRASVLASRQLFWPGAGGWVVLRRVAGRDGLMVQVRLDPAAEPDVPGFSEAVGRVVAELWPADTPRPGGVPE